MSQIDAQGKSSKIFHPFLHFWFNFLILLKGWLFLNKTAIDNTTDIPTANAIGIVNGIGGLGFVDGGLFCGELVGIGVDAAVIRGSFVGLGEAVGVLEVGVGVVTGDCD